MKVLTIISLMAIAPFAVWSGVCAQDQAPAPSAHSTNPVGTTVVAQDHYFAPSGQNVIFENHQDHQKQAELQGAFRKAFAAYQSAKDDEARGAAREELGDVLDKQYDAFIEGQAKQIAELDERLAKLRTQLQKRKEAKSRMVELKLQMVLSQAEGLGFPDNNAIHWGQGYGGAAGFGAFPAPASVNMSVDTLYGGGISTAAPLSPAELPAVPSAATQPEPAKTSGGGAR